ncbi:MAG: DeoR/GlpR transcriptional regulator [Mycoplasma sp.]|nr:DeoR/GlpR transcriptional regulator [Mycoplasma sp.]
MTYLDKLNKVSKVYGGVKKKIKNIVELDFQEKLQKNIKSKKIIAQKSVDLINDNDVIFLDAGSTTLKMIDYINENNLLIVTNNIDIAKILANKNIDYVLIGGKLRIQTNALIGDLALRNLSYFKFDKVFLGANAIDDDHIYTTNLSECLIKQEVIKNSENTYFLIDKSKFNSKSSHIIIDRKNINVISEDGMEITNE